MPDLPIACSSLSVLTNAATSERGSTASHSSLLRPEGVARRTLFSRLFLAYMAAPDPLCPSNSYQQQHITVTSAQSAETRHSPVKYDQTS
jgi:hypothetical protein